MFMQGQRIKYDGLSNLQDQMLSVKLASEALAEPLKEVQVPIAPLNYV